MHAIVEPGRTLLLHEMSEAVGTLAAQTARHIHLVLENDANQPGLLDPLTDPPRGKYRAQWNDDYHHAFHVLLTGETHGYYVDYREAAAARRADARRRLCLSGRAVAAPPGRAPRRAEFGACPPPPSSISCRTTIRSATARWASGCRCWRQPAALEAALAVTLLAPAPPLLFMGDEWGTRRPFPFFCDFTGDLAEAVRNGRRKEFAEAYEQHSEDVPDPLAKQTVFRATLDWSAIDKPPHSGRLDLVKRLLAARKTFVVPRLPHLRPGHGTREIRRHGADRQMGVRLRRGAVAAGQPRRQDCSRGPRRSGPAKPVWGGAPPELLPPWSVYAVIEAR